MSFDETMDAYRELINLGYPARSSIEMLEEDTNADPEALNTLKLAQQYGI